VTENNPRNNDLRKVFRQRRLGESPVCVACGYSKPEGMKLPIPQDHHVAGQANDPQLIARLCFNCHAEAHELMRNAGVKLSPGPRNVLDLLLVVLKGVASFFVLLAARLRDWAERLQGAISALDREHPGWRHLPEVSS
jgi:hypothetical protein